MIVCEFGPGFSPKTAIKRYLCVRCSGTSSTDGFKSESNPTPGRHTSIARDPQTSSSPLFTDVPSLPIAGPVLSLWLIYMHLSDHRLSRLQQLAF